MERIERKNKITYKHEEEEKIKTKIGIENVLRKKGKQRGPTKSGGKQKLVMHIT